MEKLIILFLLYFSIGISLVYADDKKCPDGSTKKGYWFYCENLKQDKVNEKNVRKELPAPPRHSDMMKMHPDDIKKMQKEYLKEAVWKPTPKKVLNYYMVQDVARRKALAFTAVTNMVMLKNPEINAWDQYAKTNSGRTIKTQQRNNETQSGLSRFRKDHALIVFTKKHCPYCVTQKNILSLFADKYGWKIRTVDIEDKPEFAQRFNITFTPITIVIRRNTKKWMPVAVGEEALTSIEANTYRAIRYMNGKTRPEQYLNMKNEDGGILDPIAIRSARYQK